MKNRYKYAFGGMLGLDEEDVDALSDAADSEGLGMHEYLGKIMGDDDNDSQDSQDTDDDEDDSFAYGGVAKKAINVEGGEVVHVPGRKPMKVKGSKHEQGGVDMSVPQGTKIYSDRLTVGGKTMQERKLLREDKLKKLKSAITGEDTQPRMNGLNRKKMIIDAEDAKDMALQKAASKILPQPQSPQENIPQAGFGMEVPYFSQDNVNQLSEIQGLQNKTPGLTVPTVTPTTSSSSTGAQSPFTLGDYVGMGANLVGAIAPLINSRHAAMATRPFRNRYAGVGHDALQANTAAQNAVAGQTAEALTDVNTSSNAAYQKNNNSASSVNTLRALDAVTNMNTSKARLDARGRASQMMSSLLAQRGQLSNTADIYDAKGQTDADMMNARSTDNYFSNHAADISNFATNIEGLGRNLNTSKQNQDSLDLLGLLSENGITVKRGANGKYALANTK